MTADDAPAERIERLAAQTSLTERQAQAYVLVREVGKTEQEAADEMGIAPGTVRSHCARAKAKIDGARILLNELTGMLPSTMEEVDGDA